MTSLGTPELVVGSVSSVHSIRDTIESCQCVQHGHPIPFRVVRLMPHRPLYFIDRRSQLMSSTARVVPVGLRTDDEPSHADDDEENSGTRTPQAAFIHDFRWDEDEPVIPTYSTFQRPVHTPNESRRVSEVQAPTWISQSPASMDERSPLLSCVVSEAVPATSQATAPWQSPNSVPPKSPAIVQSTFSQTVSDRILPFVYQAHSVCLAFQCHRLVTWHWHALRASCVLVCGVDLWDLAHCPLRNDHVLYVRHSSHTRLLTSSLTIRSHP
jgi:hypothetical protein